jgi:hypothetical protein
MISRYSQAVKNKQKNVQGSDKSNENVFKPIQSKHQAQLYQKCANPAIFIQKHSTAFTGTENVSIGHC